MRRPLLSSLALLLLATPAPAGAAPAFSIEDRALTPLTQLPARVATRLTITGSGQEERFHLQTPRPVVFSGAIRVVRAAAVPSGLRVCEGTWQRFHTPRPGTGRYSYYVVLEPGGTAFADGTDLLTGAPWIGEEEMGLGFRILPEFTDGGTSTLTGGPLTLTSDGPFYRGASGVEIRLRTTGGRIVGMTSPSVDSGRVILRARRAGASRSIPVATLPVRDGVFSTRWLAPRGGRWEVYAQYRTARPRSYADDASECGFQVVVR
jgi:hypothetical protein